MTQGEYDALKAKIKAAEKLSDEKQEIAARLSEAVRKHDEVDADKKASAKSFSIQIEEANKVIRDLANLYKQGHEYRDYECEVIFDYASGALADYDRNMKAVRRYITKESRRIQGELTRLLSWGCTVTADITGDATTYSPNRKTRVKTIIVEIKITDAL